MKFLPPATLLAFAFAIVSCASTTPVEWRQVKGNPPTYYPAAFESPPGGNLPRGNWVSDENRKVNFFVPEAGTGEHTAAEIHRDAVSRVSPTSIPPAQPRTRLGVGFGVGFGSW